MLNFSQTCKTIYNVPFQKVTLLFSSFVFDMKYISFLEQKIQEFNEQRRLLSVGLEGIVQNIQNVQNLKSSRTELLTPSGKYRVKIVIRFMGLYK